MGRVKAMTAEQRERERYDLRVAVTSESIRRHVLLERLVTLSTSEDSLDWEALAEMNGHYEERTP
jgi:hypothetical protein